MAHVTAPDSSLKGAAFARSAFAYISPLSAKAPREVGNKGEYNTPRNNSFTLDRFLGKLCDATSVNNTHLLKDRVAQLYVET